MRKRTWLVLLAICCFTAAQFYAAPALSAPVTPGDTINQPSIPTGTGTVTLVPKAPSQLHLTTTGAGFVTLHWTDNSNNEEGFIIERKKAGSANYDVLESVSANTTTYEQSQLSNFPIFPGEHFYYRVKAFRGSYSSGYSNECYVEVTDSTVPIAPSNLKLEPLPGYQLKLTWDDRSNSEKWFEIQKKVEGGQYEKAGQTSSAYYVLNTPNWPGGVRYTFRIKAYNESGASYSNEASLTYPTHAPNAPTNLFIANIIDDTSTNRLKLTWTDTSDNEDGFVILRKNVTDGGDFPPFTSPTAVVGKGVTQYEDQNLDYDKVYAYMIGSFNLEAFGWTPPSQQIKTGPKPPELHAVAVSNSRVNVSWDLKSNQTYCRLDRKVEGGDFTPIGYFNATEYIDTNVSPGKKYTYRVGVFTGGFSWSNEVNITVPTSSLSPIEVDRVKQFPGTLSGNLHNTAKQIIKLNLGQTTYRVNEEVRQMDTAPFSQEGRTLMPIRYVTEPLGATLDWDGTAQKVTVKLGDKTIELWIGKNTALVNGKEVLIDPGNPQVMPISVPPGRAMLPLRFISENLGCEVNWNQETQEASLTYSP